MAMLNNKMVYQIFTQALLRLEQLILQSPFPRIVKWCVAVWNRGFFIRCPFFEQTHGKPTFWWNHPWLFSEVSSDFFDVLFRLVSGEHFQWTTDSQPFSNGNRSIRQNHWIKWSKQIKWKWGAPAGCRAVSHRHKLAGVSYGKLKIDMDRYLVGGLEHVLFFHILGIMTPTYSTD